MSSDPVHSWKVVGASVPGFGHIDAGIGGQDYFAYQCGAKGHFVAAVADGAGSAEFGFEGAKLVCDRIVSALIAVFSSDTVLHCQDADIVKPAVAVAISSARHELEKESIGLRAFAATIVGVIANEVGGTFFHIGDGAGCAIDTTGNLAPVVSVPENGEYSNETYFFSDSDWESHLRTLPFSSEYNTILLMTDGVTPFALSQGYLLPHPPFFIPLHTYFAANDIVESERALAVTLQNETIRKITLDDKTLVWSLRLPNERPVP